MALLKVAKDPIPVEVDIKAIDQKVWLLKVPKYLANRISTALPHQEIGRIRVPMDKLSSSGYESTQISFQISDKLVKGMDTDLEDDKENIGQTIPSEHQFSVTRVDRQSMVLFTVDEDNKDKQISFEGIVERKGECRPVMCNQFIALNSLRARRAAQPNRIMKQLDRTVTVFKPISRHDIGGHKKGSSPVKKCRQDKEQVRQQLFKVFEKHQYYHIKDLVLITGQPLSYLKTIVKEICVYNVKTSNKYMWELKPEYRHYDTNTNDSKPIVSIN